MYTNIPVFHTDLNNTRIMFVHIIINQKMTAGCNIFDKFAYVGT